MPCAAPGGSQRGSCLPAEMIFVDYFCTGWISQEGFAECDFFRLKVWGWWVILLWSNSSAHCDGSCTKCHEAKRTRLGFLALIPAAIFPFTAVKWPWQHHPGQKPHILPFVCKARPCPQAGWWLCRYWRAWLIWKLLKQSYFGSPWGSSPEPTAGICAETWTWNCCCEHHSLPAQGKAAPGGWKAGKYAVEEIV